MIKQKINTNGRKLAGWAVVIGSAAFLALGSVAAQAAAVLSVSSGADGCYDLLAGQTIDAGDVCYAVDGDSLMVTYITEGSWELTEAQLWVGENQDGYPMSKKGNPKIGNFPYNAGDITGAATHTFYVPLGSVQTLFDLDNLNAHCGQSVTIYALAHASVQLVDGNGNVVQTETGWSDGERAVDRGSWATRTVIDLSVTCDGTGPGPSTGGQETALMFGIIELNDGSDGICDDATAERWGWQDGPLAEDTYTNEIWAAAGNNVLSNGTHVGDVDIVVTPGNVTVTPVLFEGFEAEETHIYIGTAPVCSAAFGKDWKSNASTDIDTSNGVYVGVHFSVLSECNANGNFCDE